MSLPTTKTRTKTAADPVSRHPASPKPPFEHDSLRPPLKWAGGKRWQVPHLVPLWKPDRSRRLVEPFCGGLAVTMGLRPERALLNDINPHLISFYLWLKRGLKTDLDMKNSEQVYYRHRRRLNDLLTNGGGAKSAETAALF